MTPGKIDLKIVDDRLALVNACLKDLGEIELAAEELSEAAAGLAQ